MSLKIRIQDDVKSAMRAREKARLGVLRLITAAIKQKEVDERTELDDTAVLAVLDKMAKQRRESIEQYESAGREDLASQERYELDLLSGYLPEPLGEDELTDLIRQAVAETGASSSGRSRRTISTRVPEIPERSSFFRASTRKSYFRPPLAMNHAINRSMIRLRVGTWWSCSIGEWMGFSKVPCIDPANLPRFWTPWVRMGCRL